MFRSVQPCSRAIGNHWGPFRGAYPTVGLADARKHRDAEKKKLEFGNDPTVDRKRAKAAAKISAANTFAAVAKEYTDSKMMGEGRAEATNPRPAGFSNNWNLPAAKMKARRAHAVPLSRQVKEMLIELRGLTGAGKYVFRPLMEQADR